MADEPGFLVRDYWAADYPHVADIWERTGISTPGRGDTAEVIENTLRRNGRLLVLVDKASDIVIGTSWLTNDGRRLYMHHFAIDPKFQGAGLSKRLLRESFRLHQHELAEPLDIVLVARPVIAGRAFADVEKDFLGTLRRAGLLAAA